VSVVLVEEHLSVTYSGSVFVALVIQHAMRIRHIIFSSVACLTVWYYSKLSHKIYFYLY